MNIKIYKRYNKAEISNNIMKEIIATETGKVTPSKCPAIRHAYKFGFFILSPNDYSFKEGTFSVKAYNCDNKLFLDPGVMGDPNSNHLYARIDTGYSFLNLEHDVLITKVLTPFMNTEYEIPPVIYPKNYIGPILAPISSNLNITISKGTPLLHVIPLCSEYSYEEINKEIIHESFEGLFYDSMINKLDFIEEKNCREFMV